MLCFASMLDEPGMLYSGGGVPILDGMDLTELFTVGAVGGRCREDARSDWTGLALEEEGALVLAESGGGGGVLIVVSTEFRTDWTGVTS